MAGRPKDAREENLRLANAVGAPGRPPSPQVQETNLRRYLTSQYEAGDDTLGFVLAVLDEGLGRRELLALATHEFCQLKAAALMEDMEPGSSGLSAKDFFNLRLRLIETMRKLCDEDKGAVQASLLEIAMVFAGSSRDDNRGPGLLVE